MAKFKPGRVPDPEKTARALAVLIRRYRSQMTAREWAIYRAVWGAWPVMRRVLELVEK